jgi:hypothetical protein
MDMKHLRKTDGEFHFSLSLAEVGCSGHPPQVYFAGVYPLDRIKKLVAKNGKTVFSH